MITSMPPKVEPYFVAIGAALRQRGTAPEDYRTVPEYRKPRYVVEMCKTLHSLIGNPQVTMHDVLKADGCAAGHVDYQRKLALYCHQLAQGKR